MQTFICVEFTVGPVGVTVRARPLTDELAPPSHPSHRRLGVQLTRSAATFTFDRPRPALQLQDCITCIIWCMGPISTVPSGVDCGLWRHWPVSGLFTFDWGRGRY